MRSLPRRKKPMLEVARLLTMTFQSHSRIDLLNKRVSLDGYTLLLLHMSFYSYVYLSNLPVICFQPAINQVLYHISNRCSSFCTRRFEADMCFFIKVNVDSLLLSRGCAIDDFFKISMLTETHCF
ncbi:Uncharacterized protein EbC_pEb17201470 (plasmid) [Erwinia billingiae Eb661]|uniref:Uncharacterized protein n=1 Tax=Erwinia billingiae (strain Eb661) TaxID=634500 RepID=D8MK02_ERWBE|nr:Uncharacterized protein EbC_pEb17201470 [Erwinia billingiae Eb661]